MNDDILDFIYDARSEELAKLDEKDREFLNSPKVDFNKTAKEVYNQIRGMYPFPVAYTSLDGNIIKVCESKMGSLEKGKCGQIIKIYKDGIGVMCKDKEIIITRIKPSGKKEMSVQDYLNGNRNNNLEGKILC